ncbi:hypothetical protein ID871_33035 [Streptomyces pratensis]|nr:hypothetical protein [Streptomyces pratensis]
MTAVESVLVEVGLVLLAVEEELQHHPGGDHTQLHRAYRPRSSTGRRFRNGLVAQPHDHIEVHRPCRGAAEAVNAEVLFELALRKRVVREADLGAEPLWAGQGGAVEWESVVLSSLCGTRSTTGGTQAGSFYSLLKKHMATVDGVPLVCPQDPRDGRIEELADDRGGGEGRSEP